ncbi:MAG: hypothetical protein IJT88_09785 [Kiritimatiellae bacterium]|nr:hypothetical protein [Kiritimatiellia bacterium]
MKHMKCPFCNVRLDVPDELTSEEVTCPSCGEAFMADPELEVGYKAPPPAPPVRPRPAAAPVARKARNTGIIVLLAIIALTLMTMCVSQEERAHKEEIRRTKQELKEIEAKMKAMRKRGP